MWVKRNPIAVIGSFLEQKWTPNSVQAATRLYLNSEASIREKFHMAKNPKIEIYYEDLLVNSKNIIQKVSKLIEVDLILNKNVKISKNKISPEEYMDSNIYCEIKRELEKNCR